MRITIIYIQGTDTSSAKSLHQNVVQQQISEISILKAELETSKENFKQLSDIHSKCGSQKEKALYTYILYIHTYISTVSIGTLYSALKVVTKPLERYLCINQKKTVFQDNKSWRQ